MGYFSVSQKDVDAFNRDGYIFVENLFNAEETSAMLAEAKADQEMMAASIGIKDTQGRESRLALWNHPGEDLFGMVGRSRRIVDAMEAFLGDEVYHYHTKAMMKEPLVGGAWEWHQDYGYWYQNGCLYPDMASCLIALDEANKENGCLQVLKGSHKIGRVEHGRFGEQTGADPERVAEAVKRMELVYCEMKPGTAIYFHGNLLHCSAANESPRPRWSLICCYNTKTNDPYKDSHHPRYTPLKKVEDAEVLKAARDHREGDRVYMRAQDDQTIGTGKEQ